MQVHDLQPESKKDSKKRIGRGGKRGSFSGKGTKGQKKRAGATTPSYEEEIIKKFPKLRGVKNPPVTPDADVVNVKELDKHFSDGDEVSREDLEEAGLVEKDAKAVKVLGDGEIEIALTINGVDISEGAKNKIEEAGGEVRS